MIGLRDDGLTISDLSPKETKDFKTAICEIFREYNLSITIQANQNVVNFLDVQLSSTLSYPYQCPSLEGQSPKQ